MAIVATVNQFLLTLITKRLYKDLAEQELLLRVAGYLESSDNKLRNARVFWGVTLTDGGSDATDSLKLTIPKEVLERSATKTRDYVCASGSLRVSQQFKASSFEVYLFVRTYSCSMLRAFFKAAERKRQRYKHSKRSQVVRWVSRESPTKDNRHSLSVTRSASVHRLLPTVSTV